MASIFSTGGSGGSSSSSSSSSSGSAARPTYNSLKARFNTIGQRLAGWHTEPPPGQCWKLINAALVHLYATGPTALCVFKGANWNDMDGATIAAAGTRYKAASTKEDRAAIFRGLMDGTDEQISTASIEHLLSGFKAASVISPGNWDKVFEAFAWVRFPTVMTAFNANINATQVQFAHPTVRTPYTSNVNIGGVSSSLTVQGHSMGNPPGVHKATDHYKFDIDRANMIGDIAEAYMNLGVPLERVLLEMIHVAMSYTLKHVLPPFAANGVFTQITLSPEVNTLRERFKQAANILHHDNLTGLHTASQLPTANAADPRGRSKDKNTNTERSASPSAERK